MFVSLVVHTYIHLKFRGTDLELVRVFLCFTQYSYDVNLSFCILSLFCVHICKLVFFRYLFGSDLSGSLQKDDFVKLQVKNLEPGWWLLKYGSSLPQYTGRSDFRRVGDGVHEICGRHKQVDLRDRLLSPPTLLVEHLPEEEGEDDQDRDGQVRGRGNRGGHLLWELQDILLRPLWCEPTWSLTSSNPHKPNLIFPTY